jgi:hypothetical protein
LSRSIEATTFRSMGESDSTCVGVVGARPGCALAGSSMRPTGCIVGGGSSVVLERVVLDVGEVGTRFRSGSVWGLWGWDGSSTVTDSRAA